MRYAREISGVFDQFFMQAHKRFLKTICACLLLPPILFLTFFYSINFMKANILLLAMKNKCFVAYAHF